MNNFVELFFFSCGVTVFVVGNGHDDLCSNPGRNYLHFTSR